MHTPPAGSVRRNLYALAELHDELIRRKPDPQIDACLSRVSEELEMIADSMRETLEQLSLKSAAGLLR